MTDYPFVAAFDRARYSTPYLLCGPTEDEVQAMCVSALRTRWRARVTVIDVGERRMRGRLVRRLGVSPRALLGLGGANERGIVDLAVTFPGGRAGWFECKRPAQLAISPKTRRLVQVHAAGEPTAEQLAFLLEQARFGAVAGVLWSHKDLETLVAAELLEQERA